MSKNFIQWLFFAEICIISLLLISIVFQNIKKRVYNLILSKINEFILHDLADNPTIVLPWFIRWFSKLFFLQSVELRQNAMLSKEQLKYLNAYISQLKIDKYYIKRLSSIFKSQRIEAGAHLGYIINSQVENALITALEKEPNYSVKLYFVNALTIQQAQNSIPHLVASLVGAPEWYQVKCQQLICEFGQSFYTYLSNIYETDKPEIQLLIIRFAGIYIANSLRDFLHIKALHSQTIIAHAAVNALLKFYPDELNNSCYLNHKDCVIQSVAIQSLGTNHTYERIKQIVPFLKNKELYSSAVYSISTIIRHQPHLIDNVIALFYSNKHSAIKTGLAHTLSERVELMVIKLLNADNNAIRDLIKAIILQGKTSAIIGLLNRNRNIDIENELLSILREVLPKQLDIKREFCTYLQPRLLTKLQFKTCPLIKKSVFHQVERIKVIILRWLLASAFGCAVIFYVALNWSSLRSLSFNLNIVQFVIQYNYALAIYFVALNCIYLILVILAMLEVRKQIHYWHSKKRAFLFKQQILPSISIIAPAYGEEATIIESTNSLLNLEYPNYELIIVNDGSADNTLNTIVDYFKLERVDQMVSTDLATKPIRGIYQNASFPKLTVIDKENGGKADALNVGINVSKNDFFCAIDSDSLLESQALLNIMTSILDSDTEIVAAGGNIMPINGCRVDRGMLTQKRIPTNPLASCQLVEYLRAFISGRLGWVYINALTIISGAFGVFNRRRVVEIGGYLTESEKYHKNTVGEDMELIVRLSRHLYEQKVPFRIHQAFNANCWTEVPESLNILYQQRDRWQRGLIDILTFHRKMIMNPKYGTIGLIVFPYFFIFEFLGPLFEATGYVMLIIAIIMGLINSSLALLLFSASILMGISVSLFSIFITQTQLSFISAKEMVILIGYTIMENFGYRQLASFWRVTGYFSSMKQNKGWGKMVRKGFRSS